MPPPFAPRSRSMFALVILAIMVPRPGVGAWASQAYVPPARRPTSAATLAAVYVAAPRAPQVETVPARRSVQRSAQDARCVQTRQWVASIADPGPYTTAYVPPAIVRIAPAPMWNGQTNCIRTPLPADYMPPGIESPPLRMLAMPAQVAKWVAIADPNATPPQYVPPSRRAGVPPLHNVPQVASHRLVPDDGFVPVSRSQSATPLTLIPQRQVKVSFPGVIETYYVPPSRAFVGPMQLIAIPQRLTTTTGFDSPFLTIPSFRVTAMSGALIFHAPGAVPLTMVARAGGLIVMANSAYCTVTAVGSSMKMVADG